MNNKSAVLASPTRGLLSEPSANSAGPTGRLLMQARELSKSFGGQKVLDSISVDVHEGEVVLLEGDNGSGKTTLLNILTGNLSPDAGSIWLAADGTEESFRFPLRWWQQINPFNHFTSERVAREAVGRTWQEARLFQSLSLLNNIAVAAPGQTGENPARVLLQFGRARQHERGNRAESVDLLAELGLGDRKDSLAGDISQGQTKRVAIARAIRAGARILFLDEPLAGLDGEGVDSVMAMLQSIVRSSGVTLVIVEHVFNIPRIRRLADTIWTLHDGCLGVTRSASIADPASAAQGGLVPALLNQLSGPEDITTESELSGGASIVQITRRHPKAPLAPILSVRDLVVRRNGQIVVGENSSPTERHGLSFTLLPQDVLIINAPNGWGKSTLLEALVGLVPASGGAIHFQGIDALKLRTWELAALGMALITTRSELFPGLTVKEFATLHRHPVPAGSRELDLSRRLGELSGGERKKLALSTLTTPGTLALLDEPFLGLDSTAVDATIQAIRALRSQLSGTLVIALPSASAGQQPRIPIHRLTQADEEDTP